MCLSSVSFLNAKHLKNRIFTKFCTDELYQNLLKRSHFGQNQTKISDFTRRPECVAMRRYTLQHEKEMLEIGTAEKTGYRHIRYKVNVSPLQALLWPRVWVEV